MKKILILFLTLSCTYLFAANIVFAQSATPTKSLTPTKTVPKTTPSPTLTPQDKQIEKIKDLVASRVAELKLVDKRAIVGKVKSVSNTQITINNLKNKEEIIEIDELTKFESDSKDSFGISDIKKDNLISAIGLYNKQNERLLARFIALVSNIPINIEGVVLDRNTADFSITIATAVGEKKVVNVETSTKTSSFEEGEVLKSGFSKIQKGERILVAGFADKTNPDEINASRIMRLSEVSLSKKLKEAAK